MKKSFLVFLFFLTFIHPSGVLATSEKCCERWNSPLHADIYSYNFDRKKCTVAVAEDLLDKTLDIACTLPSMKILPQCWLDRNLMKGGLPSGCVSGEECDPASKTCQGPEEISSTPGDIKDPSCPLGFTQAASCFFSDPDYCCKASPLPFMCAGADDIRNPNDWFNNCDKLKAKIPKENVRGRTYCGGINWMYISKNNNCKRIALTLWGARKDCLDGRGVSTAIGCVPTDDLTDFLKFLLKFAFFASGGIILLMVIATGYMLMTSQGNPEKLQAAKENIVALFSGLILIAFSLVLLQTIGADILKLPTF